MYICTGKTAVGAHSQAFLFLLVFKNRAGVLPSSMLWPFRFTFAAFVLVENCFRVKLYNVTNVQTVLLKAAIQCIYSRKKKPKYFQSIPMTYITKITSKTNPNESINFYKSTTTSQQVFLARNSRG